jgi:hypothetical protein
MLLTPEGCTGEAVHMEAKRLKKLALSRAKPAWNMMGGSRTAKNISEKLVSIVRTTFSSW